MSYQKDKRTKRDATHWEYCFLKQQTALWVVSYTIKNKLKHIELQQHINNTSVK